MKAFIQSVVQKHTPPVVSVILSIVASSVYIGEVINNGFVDLKSNLVYEAREPFYLTTEYLLKKQAEKIDTNPEDLKKTDIELLSIHCNDDFGRDYVPRLPPNRRINAEMTCSKIGDLYKGRSNY